MAASKAKMNSSQGSRIKGKRSELELTQSTVANHIGVTPPTIGQWERDETTPKGEHVIKLADILGVSPGWIITGIHSPVLPATSNTSGDVFIVPVISMEDLSKKFSIAELQQSPMNFKAVTRTVSPNSFAVTIAGDAMLNPHGGPSMPDGTTVIVDPEINCIDKSFVIAITKKGGPLFRQYMKDGPYLWLKALNPDYSKLEFLKGDVILGTVVCIMTDLDINQD